MLQEKRKKEKRKKKRKKGKQEKKKNNCSLNLAAKYAMWKKKGF